MARLGGAGDDDVFRRRSGAALEQATRLQLGGGLSVRVNTNFSFYANADYQFAVGNTDGGKRDGVRGAAGVRYTW